MEKVESFYSKNYKVPCPYCGVMCWKESGISDWALCGCNHFIKVDNLGDYDEYLFYFIKD